jgi:hypothetical protein
MKKVLIIAVALIAALPIAHATVYNFTSAPSAGVSVAAYTITSGDPQGAVGSTLLYGTDSGVYYDPSGKNAGAGVTGTGDNVTNTSFLVVDFSSPVLPSGDTVSVEMYDVTDGYIIYGTNSAFSLNVGSTTNGSIGGLHELAADTTVAYNGANVDAQFKLAASYQYLVITANPACELDLNYISYTPTPEPGTFVMAGMALIGLGAALRKTRKS